MNTDDEPKARGEDRSTATQTATQNPDAGLFEDMQSLMDAQEAGFRTLRPGQTIRGMVVSVGDDGVLIDVGAKSEGIIPREELADGPDVPELQYGQEILVHVLAPDTPRGPVLSYKRAQSEQAWIDVEAYIASGEPISASVVDHNRGGAIVDYRGLRGFIPLSQLVSLPSTAGGGRSGPEETQERLEQIHGQKLNLRVLEVNRGQNRFILSERAVEQEERERKRAALLAEIRPGEIRSGRVRSVTDFGAFVDLGGADGLVHVSEMGHERVQNPRSVVQPGQEVDVFVLEVRPEDQRISLSLRRAMADPWETIAERLQAGQTVEVTIKRLTKFGAFAEVEPGVDGLIHISELALETPREAGQVVREGQQVQAKIIHIDQSNRRLGLSMRQLEPSEVEMTAEEWHQEQQTLHEPAPSAFDALNSLAGQLDEQELESPPQAGTATTEPDATSRQETPESGRETEPAGESEVVHDEEEATEASQPAEVTADSTRPDSVPDQPAEPEPKTETIEQQADPPAFSEFEASPDIETEPSPFSELTTQEQPSEVGEGTQEDGGSNDTTSGEEPGDTDTAS